MSKRKRGTHTSKNNFKRAERSATRMMIFRAKLERIMEERATIQLQQIQSDPLNLNVVQPVQQKFSPALPPVQHQPPVPVFIPPECREREYNVRRK